MAEGESYIDQLNNTISGLEAEMLQVSNNIVTLKEDYNTQKTEYEAIIIKIKESKAELSKVLLELVTIPQEKNKQAIEEICAREKNINEKEAEFVHIQKTFEEKTRKFDEEIVKSNKEKLVLSEKHIQLKKDEQKLKNILQSAELTKNNALEMYENVKERERNIEIIEKKNNELKNKLEKEEKEIKTKRELFENEHGLKRNDLERREQAIIDEKAKIESQWQALKQAKKHLDNIKQGS